MNTIWQGRNDGDDPLVARLFQNVTMNGVVEEKDFFLHGFAVDEGVRRNKGRTKNI